MIPTFRILAVASLLLVGSVADAQTDRRLEKLDAETRSQVETIIGSSRAAGVPTEWLIKAALEAVARGGKGADVVNFVSKRAGYMTIAHDVLAPATEAEIVSGAGVLERGVRRETLAELRKKRPRADLTMSLGVLENLVSRGVPGDTAASVMVALASSGLRDNDLELFKERVNRDIALGINPSSAATARAEMTLGDAAPNSLGSSRGPTAAAPLPKRPP
jgi:hypothetical protein